MHVADDGYYSVIDGAAVLELMGEPLSDLLVFAQEVGQFIPKPVSSLVPLAGKSKINVSQIETHALMHIAPHSPASLRLDLPITTLPVTVGNATVSNYQNKQERTLPLWASRVNYRMTRATYDSNTSEIIEHELPPPITPMLPSPLSNTRRSVRSTTSVFRKPSTVNPPSPHFGNNSPPLSTYGQSPKAVRSSEEAWVAALKVHSNALRILISRYTFLLNHCIHFRPRCHPRPHLVECPA